MAIYEHKSKKIESREPLEAWLNDNPLQVAQAIAMRAALRVLPLVGKHNKGMWKNALFRILSATNAFRCILLSVVAVDKKTTFDESYAVSAATYEATETTYDAFAEAYAAAPKDDIDADPATAAAAGAAEVYASDADAAYVSAEAVYASAEAAAVYVMFIWRAVDADCQVFDAGKSVDEVMRLPIWHGQTPDWARAAWREMAESQELLGAGFTPWLRWYEAAAAFDAPAAQDYFGPELSSKIALQPDAWWKRGAEAVNADIADWLAPLKADDMRQSPAARRFGAVEGRIDLLPPAPQPSNPRMAEILLAEFRRKAAQLRGRLQGHNAADPRAGQALDELLDVLPQQAADLETGLLLSRSRSVEALLSGFNDSNEAELFPGAVAEIADVVESMEDLKACYPEIREIERERRAQQVVKIGMTVVVQGMRTLAAGAAQSGGAVAPPAQAALQDAADQAKNAATEKLQEELAGDAMAAGHNFVKAAVPWALREAEDIGAGAYKGFKQKTIDGLAQVGLASVAALLANIHPAVGEVFYLAANGQTKMLFDAVKRIVDRAVNGGDKTPPDAG